MVAARVFKCNILPPDIEIVRGKKARRMLQDTIGVLKVEKVAAAEARVRSTTHVNTKAEAER